MLMGFIVSPKEILAALEDNYMKLQGDINK